MKQRKNLHAGLTSLCFLNGWSFLPKKRAGIILSMSNAFISFVFWFCVQRRMSGFVVSNVLINHLVPGSVLLHGTLGKCILL